MPAPGSEAERLLKERQARKKAAKGIVEDSTPVIEQPRGQRQQPKRKDRQKGVARPVGTSDPGVEDAPVEDAPVVDDKAGSNGGGKRSSSPETPKPAPKKKKQK